MPTTIRKQIILDALKGLLQGILTTSGYYSSIGSKVTEMKVNPLGANRVDGINYFEDPDTPELITRDAEDESIENHLLAVVLQVTSKNPTTPATVRQYEADVRKAIGTNETYTNQATFTDHISTAIDKDQEKDVCIGLTMRIQIGYNTLKLSES